MRRATITLLAILLWATGSGAAAQSAPPRSAALRVPISLSFSVPVGRPDFSAGSALRLAGLGALGGWGAAMVVMLPLAAASWDSDASNVEDGLVVALTGAAFLAGHTAGIHYGGRREGMRASPWATAGGVLAGLTLAGATVQADENGDAEPNLLILIAPAAGGVTGYALTRRHRER